MDIDAQTDLAAMHDAIVAGIKAQFPLLATVEFYREDRKSIPSPACLLNLVEMEYADDMDSGTGQAPMRAKFEAELIVGFKTQKPKLAVRVLAGALAAYLKTRRWPGIYADPCQVIGCYKDDFEPELDQYEVQKVEWTQVIFLGDSYWNGPTFQPENVFLGFVPDVGHGHEADYIQVAP